jgi:hypothetical protein
VLIKFNGKDMVLLNCMCVNYVKGKEINQGCYRSG